LAVVPQKRKELEEVCEYVYLCCGTNTTKKIYGKTRGKNQIKILSYERDFLKSTVNLPRGTHIPKNKHPKN